MERRLSPSTEYVIDDIVKFGANTYVATTNHTSAASETTWYDTDLSYWFHAEGIRNVGSYTEGTFYKVNDVVKFGNTQYRVTAGIGTTAGLRFAGDNDPNVVSYVSGFNGEGAWDPGTVYETGDVIAYYGTSYVAITTLRLVNHHLQTLELSGTYWQKVLRRLVLEHIRVVLLIIRVN